MTTFYFRPVDGFDQSILTLEDMLYYGEDISSKLETNLTEHLVKRIYLGVKMLQGYNIEVIEDVIDSLQNNTDLFLPVYIEDIRAYCHDYFGYKRNSSRPLYAYWVIDSAESYVRKHIGNALVYEIKFIKHVARKDNEMCLFKNDDTGERLIVSTLSLDQHVKNGATVVATRMLNKQWRFQEISNQLSKGHVSYSYDTVFE